MLLFVLALDFDDKKQLFDCFTSSDIQIIPSLNMVCLDIAYPVVVNVNCSARLPHGVLFRATLDSLFDGTTYHQLEAVISNFSHKVTSQVCFLCTATGGMPDCSKLDQTNQVTVTIESQTHRASLDIKSIRIDRLQDSCLTATRAVFDDMSICWNFWLTNSAACLAYYGPSGSFTFVNITYQVLLNDGSNVREADVFAENSTTTFTASGAKIDLFVCRNLTRSLNLQRNYVTTTNLLVRYTVAGVIVDAYMYFYVLAFTNTENVIQLATLTVQENSARIVLLYDTAEAARLNRDLDNAAGIIKTILFKIVFSISASNEFLEIAFETDAYRFGDAIDTQICANSLDPAACIKILYQVLQMKQTQYNAYFLIFFQDAARNPIMEVLKTIAIVKYSCLQTASASIYYDKIQVVVVPRQEQCDYQESDVAISFTWTNITTGDKSIFTNVKSINGTLVFEDAKFKALYDAGRRSNDYLMFLNLGFDGVFPSKLYFRDYRVMKTMEMYGFIGIGICCIGLTIFIIFDHKIFYRIYRNKKRVVRSANGEIVCDDL